MCIDEKEIKRQKWMGVWRKILQNGKSRQGKDIDIQWIFYTHFYVFNVSECSHGWTYSDHTKRCYKHYSELKTWSAARAHCQAQTPHSGDLASVPDQDTNDFLTTLTNETVWIGGFQVVFDIDVHQYLQYLPILVQRAQFQTEDKNL